MNEFNDKRRIRYKDCILIYDNTIKPYENDPEYFKVEGFIRVKYPHQKEYQFPIARPSVKSLYDYFFFYADVKEEVEHRNQVKVMKEVFGVDISWD